MADFNGKNVESNGLQPETNQKKRLMPQTCFYWIRLINLLSPLNRNIITLKSVRDKHPQHKIVTNNASVNHSVVIASKGSSNPKYFWSAADELILILSNVVASPETKNNKIMVRPVLFWLNLFQFLIFKNFENQIAIIIAIKKLKLVVSQNWCAQTFSGDSSTHNISYIHEPKAEDFSETLVDRL